MRKIICVHLYNDYSGSPLVLSTAIKGLVKNGESVTLLSSDSKGFLSNLPVEETIIPYSFHPNKIIRLLKLLLNQWQLFWKVIGYRKEDVQIYINTLLPFGAALAGKLIGKEVIYHIHETSVRPQILKRFLKFVTRITAKKVIYVSNYLQETEGIKTVPSKVVHNALSKDFTHSAKQFISQSNQKAFPFTVLMLCSLKKYKGVDEFVAIANSLPEYRFKLVLNADTSAINSYFDIDALPKNLIIFPKQNNVHWFYQNAHLVLNLSDPNEWVETFGMTLLEALSYGLPAIAPTVGGPTEIIHNKYNGYLIDSKKTSAISLAIKTLANTPSLYNTLSKNALASAEQFQETKFQKAMINTFSKKRGTLVNEKVQKESILVG